VDGKPAVLIVDYGSSKTIISLELGNHRAYAQNTVSTSKGSGWTGAGVSAKATLTVGPFTWRDRRVVVMDLHELSISLGQKVDGLLGMDFLSEFNLVILDSKHHKLILER